MLAMRIFLKIASAALIIAFSSFPTSKAIAHPVTFEDGVAFSSIIQPHAVVIESAYSMTSRVALGATYLRLSGIENRVMGGFANSNLLLFRHNGEASQANLYVIGGLGLAGDNEQRLMGLGAMQADYETTRFYTALMGRFVGDDQTRWWQTTYRIGVAPYEAEFNELQSWLVGQVVYAEQLNRVVNFTTMLRFFYRTVLWEVGGDLNGRPWIQLMVHY